MGFIICVLCELLFVLGALRCCHARLNSSGQGITENAVKGLNNAVDTRSTDFFRRSLDHKGKDTNSVDMDIDNDKTVDDGKEEGPVFDDDSEESSKDGLHQRANAEKRRMLNKEQMRHDGLKYQDKGSDMPEDPGADKEPANLDRETAPSSKSSDMEDMHAILGPGHLFDPITHKPITSSIIGTSMKSGLLDLKHAPNISPKNDDLVSFVGEHRRGNRRKFKLHNSLRKANDAFKKLNDEVIPVQQPMKESREFRKHKSMLHGNEQEKVHQGIGFRKRKHKNIHNEPLNTMKEIENFHLNEEEEYANLSIINKKLQSANSKKFDFQNNVDDHPDDEALLDREEPNESVTMVSDKDDAEHESSEEEEISLREETAKDKKINGNCDRRSNSRTGISSEMENCEWLNDVTQLPLTDYSIRKNKKKISPFDSEKKIPDESVAEDSKYSGNKKHKKKKYVDAVKKINY